MIVEMIVEMIIVHFAEALWTLLNAGHQMFDELRDSLDALNSFQ